jgi:hypothetical protein
MSVSPQNGGRPAHRRHLPARGLRRRLLGRADAGLRIPGPRHLRAERGLGAHQPVARLCQPTGNGISHPTPSPTPSAGPVTPCTNCGTVASGDSRRHDQDVFKPQTVAITVGQVVEWKNTGNQPHTVTFPKDAAINDNLLSSCQTFEVIFTQVGNFYYQ